MSHPIKPDTSQPPSRLARDQRIEALRKNLKILDETFQHTLDQRVKRVADSYMPRRAYSEDSCQRILCFSAKHRENPTILLQPPSPVRVERQRSFSLPDLHQQEEESDDEAREITYL